MIFDAIANALKSREWDKKDSITPDEAGLVAHELSLNYNNSDAAVVQAVHQALRVDDAQREQHNSEVVGWMAALDWKVARDGVCWTRRIGFWVGYPFSYEATTTLSNGDPNDTDDRAKRNVKTLGAFGLGFSPNTYFTILVGLSLATVTRQATSTRPEVEGTLWATTVAIGGNLDLVTNALKQ